MEKRLTETVSSAGCAAKIASRDLADVLLKLPKQPANASVLIGYDTADDAGVYKLTDELALVQTVDFFTPIVDDPYVYGKIAAINSLSDVWAMGGDAITALSVTAFPREGLDFEILGEIMRGGLDVLTENNVALLGGHTIHDNEIKFGYAVTGLVDPSKIVTNTGARAGDLVVLTKPLGTGIVSTAIKYDRVPPEAAEASMNTMLHTSRLAAKLMLEHGVHGGTDVTGFGLAGHGGELAAGSGVTIRIDTAELPLLPYALELAGQKNTTRGGRSNREYHGARVRLDDALDPNLVHVLFDPQTAGGLLLAFAPDDARAYVERARQGGYVHAAIVGACEARRDDLLVDMRA